MLAWGKRLIWGEWLAWGKRLIWGEWLAWVERLTWAEWLAWGKLLVCGEQLGWMDGSSLTLLCLDLKATRLVPRPSPPQFSL